MLGYLKVTGIGEFRVGRSEEEPFFKKEETQRESMYERRRRQVYATGNKWAIENFHATHD